MTNPGNNSNSKSKAGIRVVEISRQPIELYKILKFEGLVANGGEAKAAVAAGQVILNGTVETQKRKKIVSGDTIEFGGEEFLIELKQSALENVTPPTSM